MAGHFTYDPTKLDSVTAGKYTGSTEGARFQIRMYLQDTDSARILFSDEEIDWAQTQEANVYAAVASLADVLVSRARGVKSKKVDELSIVYDWQFYQTLAGTMRARGMGHQLPYAGGISKSDKLLYQQNEDNVQPTIVRGLDDNPQAPQPSIPSVNPLEQT